MNKWASFNGFWRGRVAAGLPVSMPSPMSLASRYIGRKQSPSSADDDASDSADEEAAASQYPHTPPPSGPTPADASDSMEYVANKDTSSPFSASRPRRQTFSEAKKEVQAISEYAQTLEASWTDTPAPAPSRLPTAAQLPAPRPSLKVKAPSTPATPAKPADRQVDEGKDLDALLSEVARQSDGMRCPALGRPCRGCCRSNASRSSPCFSPILLRTPHLRSARHDSRYP